MNCSKLKTQMITKIQGYQSSNKTFHASLESAQMHDLYPLLSQAHTEAGLSASDAQFTVFVENVFAKREQIIDILTTTPTSKPRLRKVNGATRKPRKHIAAQNTLPLDTTEPPRAA